MLPHCCFALSVSSAVKKLKRVLEAESRHFGLPEVVPRNSHLVQRSSLTVAVVQQLQFGGCLLQKVYGFERIVCEKNICGAQIDECQRFAVRIAEIAKDGERFIEAFDTFLPIIQRKPGQAQVVQRGPASGFVSCWIENERVAVIPVRLLREAPGSIDISGMRDGGG